jgi:hypothetical protein
MKAEINADFPIQLGNADNILSDLVDFESKFTQAVNEAQDMNDAYGIVMQINTSEKNGEQVITVTLTESTA